MAGRLTKYSPGGKYCDLGVQYKNPGPPGPQGIQGSQGPQGPTGAFPRSL